MGRKTLASLLLHTTHTMSTPTQMCINADPNYGFMWLQCKNDPLDGVLRVLATAKDIFLNNGKTRKSWPTHNELINQYTT